MRAMGIACGRHTYGELAVHLHAGRDLGDGPFDGRHVVLAGTDTLAGASASVPIICSLYLIAPSAMPRCTHVTYVLTHTVVGAVAPLDDCVRNLAKWTGCSLSHAIRAASHTPARMLRIDDVVGRFAVGAYADFAVLCAGATDVSARPGHLLPPIQSAASWFVRETWVGGRLLFTSASHPDPTCS